ncbi:MAG TPA: glycine--tRNA ligase [candidate division WWE3 bacterium]|uniref:glycine--tRNA ligase n=1 Tax=candidate division WWE3 bacterium TaxID=2053526 RepID=A0A7V5MH33_UNCKA|nr:glycine--tRNA ligase [candidate division WWE3 bacterium]
MQSADKFKKIVSLAKRRGFVYPSSEIYGGLANVYDYGPLGVELLKNIRNLWWKTFVHQREDVVGLESAIFMHPKVWVASGHAKGFSDPLVEDKKTHKRYRADHLIEAWAKEHLNNPIDTDLMSVKEMNEFIKEHKIKSPEGNELSPVKEFNLMFTTKLGATVDDVSEIYLRAETAQGMYVDFKNVLDSTRVKVPFGIAQQGRVFRNEITTGRFLFRMLEFQQMELQYFFDGKKWDQQFEYWREQLENWYFNLLGLSKDKFRWKPHSKLVFYAKAAEDVQYKFPWGFDEVSGLHYRTDYDLSTHQKHSGKDLRYRDPHTGEKYLPHVLETTWGLDRNFFMLLDDAYTEEDNRTYLNISAKLAPYKIAVFPLLSNKPNLVEYANRVFKDLLDDYNVYFDKRGNIGKRYAYQDEIGTPFCVTIDFETLDKHTVTVRDRDTTVQERVPVSKLSKWIKNKMKEYK